MDARLSIVDFKAPTTFIKWMLIVSKVGVFSPAIIPARYEVNVMIYDNCAWIQLPAVCSLLILLFDVVFETLFSLRD